MCKGEDAFTCVGTYVGVYVGKYICRCERWGLRKLSTRNLLSNERRFEGRSSMQSEGHRKRETEKEDMCVCKKGRGYGWMCVYLPM